jgi:SAM-dependent methyltransferase
MGGTAPDDQWKQSLAAWAIPEELVASAPHPPYFFDPEVFIAAAEEALARPKDTMSDHVARQALPPGGTVLDVGVGAGAASLRLGASTVTGIDPSRELLDAFVERACRLGITVGTIQGTWPDASAQTSAADVVVCHHVLYNAPDLCAFAQALTTHATGRVVLELTAQHPMGWLAPYWKALYGLSQPERPSADDAIEVITALGIAVEQRRWTRRIQMIGETGDAQLARVARRLCLAADRTEELRHLLSQQPPPTDRQVVTAWWQGEAST